MSIKVGERIPSVTLMHMTDKGPEVNADVELVARQVFPNLANH